MNQFKYDFKNDFLRQYKYYDRKNVFKFVNKSVCPMKTIFY